MAKKIVMGYWDCKYCGTKKIKGTYQSCQYCGATRGTDTKFYMSGSVEYLNEEEAETKGKGADWLCAYCDTLNSTLKSSCNRCGATREASSKDYFQLQKEKKAKKLEEKQYEMNLRNGSNYNDNYSQNNYSVYKESNNTSSKKSSSFFSNYAGLFAGVGTIILFIGLLIALLIPKEKTLIVTDTSWQYDIKIESYETFTESDWQLPSNARLLYTKQEVKSYISVIDHYETKTRTYTEQEITGYVTEYSYSDNGDGTFTETSYEVPQYTTVTKTETYEEPVYRQDPVYATKYYYDIDKWVYKRTVTTKANDKTPYWGEVILASNEREGNKHEHYYITAYIVNDKDMKNTIYEIDKEHWNKIHIGNELKVKMSLGEITEFVE